MMKQISSRHRDDRRDDRHHRPCLSARHDGHRPAAFPLSGERQPDRAGWQDHRVRADRAEFYRDNYFHGRPSATTEPDPKRPGEDRTGTLCRRQFRRVESGANLEGPRRPGEDDAAKAAAENPSAPVPVDLVTTSASGLDPDITPAGALFQVPRVAKARGLPEGAVRRLVEANTTGGCWACLASRGSTC